MTLKTWLKFVEIQSLVASVLPLVLGNLYAAITYQHMNAVLAIVFVIVAFALQMAVNVWNNLQDFKSATSEEWKNGVNNIVGSGGITPRQGWTTLIALVLIVAVGGLWLVSQTGIPLLVMGLIGFVVAYWYAGTPLPLSRTPFGELASGLTMGYLIFLSATYVNVAPTFTTELVLHAIVASAISWFAIGDIMLDGCTLRLNWCYTLSLHQPFLGSQLVTSCWPITSVTTRKTWLRIVTHWFGTSARNEPLRCSAGFIWLAISC